MVRVVFDSNVWVSAAAYPGSVPDQVINLVRRKVVESVVSEAIIEEVRRTLQSERFRVSPDTVAEIEAEIRSLSIMIEPSARLSVITAKEADNRVLECAVSGGADLIVTGDRKHLLRLRQHDGIPLVAPIDLMRTFP